MEGGLIQLVAYGAQNINNINNNNNNNNNNYIKTKFFYKKIKNKKKSMNTNKSVNNTNKSVNNILIDRYNQEKYIGISDGSRIIKIHEVIVKKVKNTVNKIIGTNKINLLRKTLCKNIAMNNLINSLTINKNMIIKKIKDKRFKIINCLTRLNEMLVKRKWIQNMFINCLTYNKIKMIKNFNTTINHQKFVINKINISNEITTKIEIKNTICPITLNEINNCFIMCKVCKECYDYDGTYKWFTYNSYCACCRSYMKMEERYIYSNKIYEELKKLQSSNT